ncbi:hypothetical protein JCM3774_005799 [Rhodotorula dairenensis]
MAAQNGFLDAADLLHEYAVKLDRAEAESSTAAGRASDPQKPHGKGLRSFGSLRRKSSSSMTGNALHAQRSLDALATKFAHHAHRASASSLSVNSIRGATPLAMSSQISLGAAEGFAPQPPASVATSSTANRRGSLPGSAMRPLLHVSNDGRVRAATLGGGSCVSMSPARHTKTATRDELEDENDPALAAERAERRRSMEVNRPLRQDSFQTGLPTLASLDMACSQPTLETADAPESTPVPVRPPVSPTMRATSLPAGAGGPRFYRPRQSSGLSKGSFTGTRPSLDEDPEGHVFEDDEALAPTAPNATTPTTAYATAANRPRAVSNPDSRSPLLQHLHATQYSGPRSARSREASGESSPATALPKQGSQLAVPPSTQANTNYAGVDAAGRTRSNSTSTDASYTVSTSSSRDSSAWSGPTTFSTASASTAPTTAPPHSPTKRTNATIAAVPDGGYFGVSAIDLSNRRHLGPLYEANSPGIGIVTGARPARSEGANDPEPQRRAQTRSRVKKAERELLDSHALVSSASVGPNPVLRETASSSAAVPKSLKDQLAAYGKSSREEDRDRHRYVKRSTPTGYTIETISSTKGRPDVWSSAEASKTWTAGSTHPGSTGGRRQPPSPTRSHQSRSPGSSAPATPRAGRSPREASTAHFANPAAVPAPAKARSHLDQVRASSPSSMRSGSNRSVSIVETVPPAPLMQTRDASILGQGHGGVSYVGVLPKTHHQHHHQQQQQKQQQQHRHHSSSPTEAAHTRNGGRPTSVTRSSDKSASDRGDLASVARSGGETTSTSSYSGPPISTRNGVKEEQRRREEEEQKMPKAMRTVPGRTGFVRKLFGSKGGLTSRK